MKYFLETPYEKDGFYNYPVMAQDEDLDIDEREVYRIGTISVREGCAVGDVIDAAVKAFEADHDF